MVSSIPSQQPRKAGTSRASSAAKESATANAGKSASRSRVQAGKVESKNKPFIHPKGTDTVTQTEAMHLVGGITLTKKDLEALPFEKKISRNGYIMKLYSRANVIELARQKANRLGIVVRLPDDPYASGPSIKRAPTPPHETNPRHAPEPPTTKIRTYTPPDLCDPNDPPPEEIIWTGEVVKKNVHLEDACLIYLVQPKDLQDLLIGNSKWLDIESVARRAVTLHGGFTKHNEMVFEKRRLAMKAVEEGRDDEVGRLSANLKKSMGCGDYDASFGQPADFNIPDKDVLKRTVKQYTPVWREETSRFMNDFRWCHGFGDPLVEPEDMNTWNR